MAGVTVASFSGTLLTLFLDDTYGRHLWDIPLSAVTEGYLKTLLATGIIYNFGAMFCKLTLLTLYFRIFGSLRPANILVWIGIPVVVIFYITSSAINLVFCLPRPSDGGWVTMASLNRCDSHQQSLNFAQGVVSTVTDFYVLVIPLVMVAPLHMSLARKMSVLGVFLTGLMACGFSLAGTIYRAKAMNSVPSDASWYGLTVQALGVAELNLGLVCGCLPLIVPLFKNIAETSGTAWKSFSGIFSRGSNSKQPSGSDQHSTYGKDALGVLPSPVRHPKTTYAAQQPPAGHGPPGITSNTNIDTYYELGSVNFDYHAHIEGPSASATRLNR